jgi:hypothetical protein
MLLINDLALLYVPHFRRSRAACVDQFPRGIGRAVFALRGGTGVNQRDLRVAAGVDSAGCRGDVANRAAEGHLVEARVFPRGEKKSRAGLKPGTYILRPLDLTFLPGLRRTLAGRILRMAALPARWQARHIYQLATVR